MDCHIRWMIRRDMPFVLDIEDDSFEYPWTENDFINALRQRNCIGMVAEVGEEIVGFMLYELHKHNLHIINFAVKGSNRRKKIGSVMINKLVSKLSNNRRQFISLDVRESNVAAQLFFRSLGFKAISILHDFYEDTSEDAYRMQLNPFIDAQY